MNENDQLEELYIDCIGVDGKLHICLPWESKTKCSLSVSSKRVDNKDFNKQRYSCYECTY